MLDREFEQIEVLKDESANCLAFIAIHSTRLGPAFGGIRRWPYPSAEDALSDALDLARAMTLKCALAGVPGGGGKAVIVQRPDLDEAAAYRMIGSFVQMMSGRYYTGPDVGTRPEDLEVVASQTRFVAAPGADGAGDLSEPTALGVFAGVEAVAERLGFTALDGVEVAVQGLGEVGWRLCEMLHAAGAKLIVADLHQQRADRAGDELAARVVASAEILEQPCDVFSPCALGGVLDAQTVPQLRARGVAGSANNVLADARCGRALFERGVLVAPDFVINAGALVHGAPFHLNGTVVPPDRIREIGGVVGDILDRARSEGEPPEVIAERMAIARLERSEAVPFMPPDRRL